MMGRAKAWKGSVSSGTMRPEDLVPVFLEVLGRVDPARHALILADPEFRPWFGCADPEACDFLLDELFDALNEHVPEGCYFGAHQDDGANFGFWSEDDILP